jgi:hypothetical protein
MFTMNKDNDLEWIEIWAAWHCEVHGVDAIIIFDNGSKRYGIVDIADALTGVAGLKTIGLVSWPFLYGPIDPAALTHPYWPNFLQVASFSVRLMLSVMLLHVSTSSWPGKSAKRVFATMSRASTSSWFVVAKACMARTKPAHEARGRA